MAAAGAGKNKIGSAFLALMALYIFVNTVVFPKDQRLVAPSGIHTVTGTIDDAYIGGVASGETGNEKAAVAVVQHGDDDDPCFHYDGILLISDADEDGFATVFFLYILNQLIWAEKHNLLPWIHLGRSNIHVFDENEHGISNNPLTFGLHVLNGLHWESWFDPISGQNYSYPGKPILDYLDPDSVTRAINVDGTGVWSSYFDPPSRLDPLRHLSDKSAQISCHQKPIFQLTLQQIEPSLMVFCPYCVRAWRRKSTPPSLAKWSMPYQQWLEPMRRTANDIVKRHFQPTETFVKLAQDANPVVEAEESCLALHIRHSDKADRRQLIPLEKFRPYVEAYMQASLWVGTTIVIYVATDSNQVLKDIQATWPNTITTYMRYQGSSSGDKGVLRSDNATAVFQLSSNHHRTNKEVLVDILAMSKCEFMVHGLSAVTEATHYLNLNLHNHSVNLEEEIESTANNYIHETKATMSDKEFGTLVRTRLQRKRIHAENKIKDAPDTP